MKWPILKSAALLLVLSTFLSAKPAASVDRINTEFRAPKDAIILIIRHAEKPDSGPGLSPVGEKRARALVGFFHDFTVDSASFTFDSLYATADSEASVRPRVTLEPLGKTLKLKIRDHFKNDEVKELAEKIASRKRDKHVLICWHHGQIPNLLSALGADPAKLLPDAKWPQQQFGWVLELRYDHNGRLMSDSTKQLDQNPAPDSLR